MGLNKPIIKEQLEIHGCPCLDVIVPTQKHSQQFANCFVIYGSYSDAEQCLNVMDGAVDPILAADRVKVAKTNMGAFSLSLRCCP